MLMKSASDSDYLSLEGDFLSSRNLYGLLLKPGILEFYDYVTIIKDMEKDYFNGAEDRIEDIAQTSYISRAFV